MKMHSPSMIMEMKLLMYNKTKGVDMNLNDLLKVNSVRCIKTKVHEDLVEGEIYEVEGFNDETIKIVDRNGFSSWHNKNLFEPVINNDIDISLNSVDDVNTTFKVGNKVYKYGETDVKTVLEVFEDGYMRISNYPHRVNHETLCHATPENYERLQAIFPDIEFEQPAKELKGSDLARALIKKGWVGFNCLCGHIGDEHAITETIVTGINNSGQFTTVDGRLFNNAVPMLGSFPLTAEQVGL